MHSERENFKVKSVTSGMRHPVDIQHVPKPTSGACKLCVVIAKRDASSLSPLIQGENIDR